jgi:ribosomal protein S18 acetylase RimI-like enzyme
MLVHDRTWIRERLMQAPALHLYEIGDLDDFFWPHTTWYARGNAIALVYAAGELPVLIALGDSAQVELLASLRDELPARIYAHLSPGLLDGLLLRYVDEPHGEYLKMSLSEPGKTAGVDGAGIDRLGPEHREELLAFYQQAYPGNWFDPRMLTVGHYFARREAGRIVAAGGVHVYSAQERVAALGNIAVLPAARGRGLARQVTAAVCRSLRDTTDHIGLNVRADNGPAIACYAGLGFTRVATYEEHLLTAAPR